MIEIHFEDVVPLPLDSTDLSDWLSKVAACYSKSLGDLNLVFCTDSYLLNVNQEYLQHDYYTDIITFDYSEMDCVSGDLFISVDRVKDNAENLELHFLDELYRVIAHGVLHLCGLKDKSNEDQLIMTAAEDNALALR